MSLRWRIALGLAAIAAVASALAATGSYLTTSRQLHDSIDQSLLSRAQTIGRSDAGVDGDGNGPPGISHALAANGCPPAGSLEPASAAQLVSASGAVTECLEGSVKLPVDDADRNPVGAKPRLRTESIGGTNYRIVTIPWHAGGSIEIARSLGETEDTLSSLGLELAAFSLLGALAAGLLGWFFARRMVRPVERLRDAAEQIARTQDLDTPVPVSGAGEIRSLAGSLTTMVDALGASRRQQQQLISDASHELRTPLTSLRTNAELLGRPAGLDDDQRRRVVEGIQYEVEELTNLVSEVVELATDRSSDDEVPITVMLADVAAPVIERARRRTGREITIDQADGDRVVARPHMIERAMSNLIDNAAKYSPADTPIVVTIDGRGFEVRDHGGGIAAEDLPHIFERFYRATAARTAAGSGLGLAIVQQIVDRHGGRTWARNAPDGGAVVGFELPAAANNSSPA